jgi:membrane protease YdiL (CAAX protease family)
MATQSDDPDPKDQPATPRFAFGTSPGGFSNVVTLVMSLFISGLLFCVAAPSVESPRLAGLDRAAETAVRVFERDLWVDNSTEFIPNSLRIVLEPFLGNGSTSSTREDAIAAFEDVIAHHGYPLRGVDGQPRPVDETSIDALRARRVVLLAESNRNEEVRGDLDRLTAKGRASFVDAVQRAYSKVSVDDARTFADYDVAIAGDEWIGKRLQLRLAIATHDAGARVQLESEIRGRLERFADRSVRIALAWTIPTLLGLVIFLVWLARNRPDGPVSTALSPPAWLFENGYAVLVRAAFFGLSIAFALSQFSFYARSDAFVVWGTLLASIPLLFLLRKRLLAPLGLEFAPTFGLVRLSNPVSWILFALAVFAVDQIGAQAISTLAHMVGAASHWSERVIPTVLWGSKPIAMLDAIDTCAWAPFFGELGCRGLLYLTLRRNYPPWQAALVSAALFGAVQLHSLPGMMSVTWSGFVWALAFERCRSLWPVIACHALAQVIVVSSIWLLYR